ncbi:MAG: DUF2029 domain-containing protein [Actinobacteria bacterium]|nr:MAG: DUF2029 domain-containing protein [Actinomycetota bacterium]
MDVAIPVRSLRAWSRPVPRAAFAAFSFVTAAFLHLPGLIRQLFDPDEAAIATMGMVISRGGVLYRDVADRKPPLAPVLYAALFQISGTRDLRPVHALVAIELGAAALLVASDVRRRAGDRAAWWAAGLLITGAMVFMSRDTQAANFSHLALLPACGAIVVARRGTTKSAALAGVLLGVAVLTRQTWIIGLAPAGFSAWLHGGRRAGHVALVIAATATTILVVAFLFPFGLFWHWTFTANGSLLTGITQSQDLLVRAGAPESSSPVISPSCGWSPAGDGIATMSISGCGSRRVSSPSSRGSDSSGITGSRCFRPSACWVRRLSRPADGRLGARWRLRSWFPPRSGSGWDGRPRKRGGRTRPGWSRRHEL